MATERPPIRIPNLFVHETWERASKLYLIMLSTLLAKADPNLVVSICRRVKHHARRQGVEPPPGCLKFEVDALVEAGRYRAAWQQYLRYRNSLDAPYRRETRAHLIYQEHAATRAATRADLARYFPFLAGWR